MLADWLGLRPRSEGKLMIETTPKHFLLVEDNNAHAKLIMLQFLDLGGEIVISRVSDGEAALDYIFQRGLHENRLRPDVILLDLNLPKIDGHEVLRQLKEDEDLRAIPVVVLTTSQAEADTTEAYRRHVNSYLVKPIDFDQFRKMMRDLGQYWSAWNQPSRLARADRWPRPSSPVSPTLPHVT
jgi:two-component system, response regulator